MGSHQYHRYASTSLFESFWIKSGRFYVCIGISTIILAAGMAAFAVFPFGWWQDAAVTPLIIESIQHGILVIFGIAGIISGIRILIMPTPVRKYGQARRDRNSKVSVFLDLENQTIPFEHIPAFMFILRKFIRNRPHALFLYAHARMEAYVKPTRIFWKYGFIPIDVPHKTYVNDDQQPNVHSSSIPMKDVADMELSLHAYERGLTGNTGQDILIITADQDFLPLIRRLISLGHRVTVWAKVLSPNFKMMLRDLGAMYQEFGDWSVLQQLRGNAQIVQKMGNDTPEIITLMAFLQYIVDALKKVKNMPNISNQKKLSKFNSFIGAHISSFLPRAFTMGAKTTRILTILFMLHILAPGSDNELPEPGANDAAAGAKLLRHFLMELIAATLSAMPNASATAAMHEIAKKMQQQEDEYLQLRQKIISSPILILYLLQMAQSIGMVVLKWEHTQPLEVGIIRVNVELGDATAVSTTIPEMEKVDE